MSNDTNKLRDTLKKIEQMLLTNIPSTMPAMSDQLRDIRMLVLRPLAASSAEPVADADEEYFSEEAQDIAESKARAAEPVSPTSAGHVKRLADEYAAQQGHHGTADFMIVDDGKKREALFDAIDRLACEVSPTSADELHREIGRQMVAMTTTVRGPDEWLAIPELWRRCMVERDEAQAKLAAIAKPTAPAQMNLTADELTYLDVALRHRITALADSIRSKVATARAAAPAQPVADKVVVHALALEHGLYSDANPQNVMGFAKAIVRAVQPTPAPAEATEPIEEQQARNRAILSLRHAVTASLFAMGREGANASRSHPLREAWEACSAADTECGNLQPVELIRVHRGVTPGAPVGGDVQLPPPSFPRNVGTPSWTEPEIRAALAATPPQAERPFPEPEGGLYLANETVAKEWRVPHFTAFKRVGYPSELADVFERAQQALAAATEKAEPDARDAARLDWIASNLFERKWGGTLGQPSDWHMRGDFRHTIQRMRGENIRAAVDAASAPEGGA